MKRIKHWLLTIAVLLCSISASAHDFEVDGIYYNITSSTDMTVEVTYKGSDLHSAVYSGSILIPETVIYNDVIYSVTSISDWAFFYCDSLISVDIEANILSIGFNAFNGCSCLEFITIPESIKSMGDGAFSGCINLPNEGEVLYADKWAIGVTDKSLPRYILKNNTIGLINTFSECSNLTKIDLPDSLKFIGSSAFYESGLTSLLIPDGVISIGNHAFCNCKYLNKVDIPESVTNIGAHAFQNTIIDSIVLPKELTKIEDYTFFRCKLSSITIPEKVEEIGSYSFAWNQSLTSIVLLDSVKIIEDKAFEICSRLVNVSINSIYILNKGHLKDVFGEQVQVYNIGGDVKEISDFLFLNCTDLQSVTIPDNIVAIGESAFENCINIDSICIPENVENIGEYAFANCTSLKYVACNSLVPPVCDSKTFYDVQIDACSLGVPESLVDLYSATAPWNNFNIIGIVVPVAMNINDGEVYAYNKELAMDTITYTRTFNNTEWQALYIPFSMSYSDWSKDFDIAKINNVHQFDEDDDDVFDRTVLEVIKVKSGSLKPNHPYMIRAKSTGTKTVSIEKATLMPAESNSIDCSSVERKYVFTGTYTGVDGETMVDGMYYGMCNGELKYATNIDTSLKPFRWYMQILDRDGQVVNDIAEAKVIVRGEDDWGVTDIEDVKAESGKFVIYSIGGTLVRNVKADNINQATEGLSAGMYIINGKKHFIR